MKRVIDVTFRNVEEFRRRFPKLMQDARKDEIYNLIFECKEAEEEFEKLSSEFQEV